MLRHIISVSLASLAMTACASLIPIKANAARLILVPNQPLGINAIRRNPGDSLEFTLLLDELYFAFSPTIRDYSLTYDDTELSLIQIVNPIGLNQPLSISTTTVLARYIFQVLESVVKDGKSDISARASYQEQRFGFFYGGSVFANTGPEYDVEPVPEYDVEPVPEPLTILGTATAIGYGALFKRKSAKKAVS